MIGLKRRVEATLVDHQQTLAVARKELAAIGRAVVLLGFATFMVGLLILAEIRKLNT